uniref:platelet endothelial cell adhesion molecule isoform X2 n=1 Tax=Scatophagus argus TaxID=75038 RepID=UPI001ED80B10|nr:platelet endothelial cell adhesion molecule isoform X2 [Scatophagus argus]
MDSPRPPSLLLLLLLTFVHFWQCARGQPSYIIDTVDLAVRPSSTVQSGTTVTIQCRVSVSHNIPHLTHTFQLTRDEVLVHSSTTIEDSIVYELSTARAADSGDYECRVTVKDKKKTSIIQKLNVTGLQTPILYLSKTKPYEDEEFIAICSAPEEKGSLNFRFYQRFRNGESWMIKQSAPTGNSSQTTLALKPAGDRVLYCDYEMSLISGFKRSNRSNEITVIVRGLYISPIMNVLPSPNVYEGDILEVVCKVVSPPNNTRVFLTKDKRILKQAPVSLSHRFTVQEGDSGDLMCKAEWGSVLQKSNQTITVKEVFSKPHLTVEPTDVFEGDSFKLTCSVSIYIPERISNSSMQFSIYKDDVKLTSASTHIIVAHSYNNGNYTCKVQAASLTQSVLEKQSQALVVKAKVPVSKPVLSVVGGTLVLGKRFQLVCQSDSGTLPITYTLYGPNRLQETQVVSEPWEKAIFNYSAIYKYSDVKNFLCHANNSQHRPTKTAQLHNSTNVIEPVSKPVLNMLPSMGDVSEGQDVTLVCSVQRGSFPISFTWYHAEKEGALTSQTARKLEASYRITNVREKHKGRYYCVSNNPANETKQSHTVMIGVKLAGWKKGLITVFCILLILALILVIAFRKHLLQFKRKTTSKLSVKSAGSKVERLSLTQAEVNKAVNATPGMMGKSVWSEPVSGSESDDQNSEKSPETAEPQYTEVQTRQADPNRAPVTKGTDTVYSEVRNSKEDVPEQADGGSVEYAQLNHDADHHGNPASHDDHCVREE